MSATSQYKPAIAALISDDSINHLDHLIPLCDLLDIPLVLDSSFSYEIAQKYYPPIELLLVKKREYLFHIDQFHLFFVSDKYTCYSLQTIYRTLFGKNKYFFYCPHGNSDKGFINQKMSPMIFHNLALIYGEQMRYRIDKITSSLHIDSLITIGNLRKRFYKKYYSFFTAVSKNYLNLAVKSEYIFLYAPSWKDTENSSSFFTICKYLIEHISPRNHLIIKIHPFLLRDYLGYVTHIYEKYKNKKNLQFISDNPLIYPLLEHIDIYLGDISSVGYDFLYFNRPMFFFDTRTTPTLESKTLFACGIEVPSKFFKNPYPFIFSTLEENRKKSTIRREMYNFVFDENVTDYVLKQNILNVYYSLKSL